MSHLFVSLFAVVSPTVLLAAANMAVVASLIAGVGLLVDRALRSRPAPTRYALLVVWLALVLGTPGLVVIGQVGSLGAVQVDQSELAMVLGETESEIAADHSDTIAWETAPEAAADEDRQPVRAEHEGSADLAPSDSRPLLRIAAEGLLLVWLIGALACLARIVWGYVAVARLRRTFELPASLAPSKAARRAAQSLGLARMPRVVVSPAVPAPLAMGLFQPTIVLPTSAEDLDETALEAVMLHEVGHLVRGDLWTALAERLATACFWWSPPVHGLSARLCDLREDLCDNYVLRTQGGRPLAGLLIDLAERAMGAPRLPAAIGLLDDEPAGLAGRIARLLAKDQIHRDSDEWRQNTMTRLSPASLVMTAALGLAVLGVVVVSTVRAAAPANAPPQEPLALAPSDPPQELVKPTIELKLTTGLTRHKDGRPIKFTIEATNRAKTPQQIAFGLVDQGVTLEVRDAQGKVVAPEIGHSLRSLPTNEYVASLFPVLAPGETRKLDLSAARRDSCLVVYDLLFGRLVFNLPEGDCTIRAVLSQTELPQEKYRGHVDEKVWWKGTTQSAPLSLALAAADEGKEKAPEIREEGVVQKGLSVTVKPLRASFVEQEAMQFLVTFKNVSKEDFTFLNTPKNYLNWKFHFRDVASGSEWLAVNTAKREGFTDELAVLKAGESLEVTARVDSGFLFRREGPQDGKEGPRRDLLAGKYQLAIEIVCQGATLQRRIVPVPPLWVGEIKTKAVPFAIEKKPAGENPQGAAVVPQANRAEAGEWSVTLTSTGGNLFPGAVKIQIDVKAGKGKATRTHTPPGNPPQETPSLKEVVLSEEAVMVLEKSLEKLKAWELGDLHAPALDAPDYAVALKRGAKTHTIKMEGAKDSHLDLILAIQQCFAKGTAR